MKSEPIRDEPYQFVIRGELGDRFGYRFEGMQIERTAGTTILTGKVRDQAELLGFIGRVADLGLELLSVQQVSEGPPSNHEARHPA